jgi:nucleotide-binding universal stress UspA family protein
VSGVIHQDLVKPKTILFAAEFPINENVFAVALAQASEFGSGLIIFHAYQHPDQAKSEIPVASQYDYAQARVEKRRFEPLCQRARTLGLRCGVIVRQGLAAEQILAFLSVRKIDRVIMGTHTPGPVGKLLVGSVAEAVLRSANIPVCMVSPSVVESTYRNPQTRNILCDVSNQKADNVVAIFGANLAAASNAILILHRVIRPLERTEILADRSIAEMETELTSLVPINLQNQIRMRTRIALADPTEELLFQGRSQHANLIVLSAQGASKFAAISRSGSVYKVLAWAHCPVIALPPLVLAEVGVQENKLQTSEVNYLAGVI